jgi:hypothetical protein
MEVRISDDAVSTAAVIYKSQCLCAFLIVEILEKVMWKSRVGHYPGFGLEELKNVRINNVLIAVPTPKLPNRHQKSS